MLIGAHERVTVITAPPRQQPALTWLPPAAPVLNAHLDGDFHRDRSGIGEEDLVEAVGCDLHEELGKARGRFVGESAEHDVTHPPELRVRRGVEHGVPVAVDRGPPRAHAVDELTPVGQRQPDALGTIRDQRRCRRGEAPVRMPDVTGVDEVDL